MWVFVVGRVWGFFFALCWFVAYFFFPLSRTNAKNALTDLAEGCAVEHLQRIKLPEVVKAEQCDLWRALTCFLLWSMALERGRMCGCEQGILIGANNKKG